MEPTSDTTGLPTENLAVQISGLLQQYHATYETTCLDNVIKSTKQVLEEIPLNHPNRVFHLSTLATFLVLRFEWTDDLCDLQSAIWYARRAASEPQGRPDRAVCLSKLGDILLERFKWTKNLGDLDQAIFLVERAVAELQDLPDQESYLSWLATLQAMRFEQTDNMNDLRHAILHWKKVITETPPNHPDRDNRVSKLEILLSMESKETADLSSPKHTILYTRRAVTRPCDRPSRAYYHSELSTHQTTIFERTENLDDMIQAVFRASQTIKKTPRNHPCRAIRLSNLVILLTALFERTKDLDDLDEAILHAKQAIAELPQGHPNRAAHLSELATLLDMRFKQTDDLGDLEQAILHAEKVMTGPLDENRAIYLSELVSLLIVVFERTKELDHLDKAILHAEQAAAETLQDSFGRAVCLSKLANLQEMRFQWTVNLDDIRGAILNAKSAASKAQSHDKEAYTRLADTLAEKLKWMSNMKELENEKLQAEKTLLESQDNHDRAAILSKLSAILIGRFKSTNDLNDLEQAIFHLRKAVSETPQGHHDRAAYLSRLATTLSMRFKSTSNLGDLRLAILHSKKAASLRVHPERAIYFSESVTLLTMLYEQTKDLNDLQHTISYAEKAISATSRASDSKIYVNTGVLLGKKFKRTRDLDDLQQILSYAMRDSESLPHIVGWLGMTPQSEACKALALALSYQRVRHETPPSHHQRESSLKSLFDFLPFVPASGSAGLRNVSAMLNTSGTIPKTKKLNNRLPIGSIKLGRFILDPRDPQQDTTYHDPPIFIEDKCTAKEGLPDSTEQWTEFLLSKSHDIGASGTNPLVCISHTHMLIDSGAVFAMAYATPETREWLLVRPKDSVYFIVGYQTCIPVDSVGAVLAAKEASPNCTAQLDSEAIYSIQYRKVIL